MLTVDFQFPPPSAENDDFLYLPFLEDGQKKFPYEKHKLHLELYNHSFRIGRSTAVLIFSG